jgi:hypothetical protein
MAPEIFYKERLGQLNTEHKKLSQKKSVFGILRLGSIAAVIAAFYFLWSLGWIYVTTVSVILLFIFIQLIYKDLANKAAIEHLSHLIKINQDELTALLGSYYHFADGSQWIPKEHHYANDMDLLGHASLFQYLNRTTSEMGAGHLAEWLLAPATTTIILARQEAVKELSKNIHWRQELQAYGKEKSITYRTLLRLEEWLKQPYQFLPFKAWQWMRYVLPAIMLGISAAAWLDWISMNIFYGAFFLR